MCTSSRARGLWNQIHCVPYLVHTSRYSKTIEIPLEVNVLTEKYNYFHVTMRSLTSPHLQTGSLHNSLYMCRGTYPTISVALSVLYSQTTLFIARLHLSAVHFKKCLKFLLVQKIRRLSFLVENSKSLWLLVLLHTSYQPRPTNPPNPFTSTPLQAYDHTHTVRNKKK